MHRSVSFVLASLLVAVAPASAQQLLPHSLSGWTQAGDQPFAAASAPHPAGSAANPAASAGAIDEYGFAGGESSSYTRGSESLQVNLYRMKDGSGAYGLYSYLHTPDMLHTNLGEHSLLSNDHALLLVGNFVVEVRGPELAKSATELKSLVAAVQPHVRDANMPTLPQRLPEKDLVARTDRYVLGPQALDQFFPDSLGSLVAFSKGAEAELASYRVGGHDATLLIVDYPTPQMAESALADMGKKFDVNGSNPGANLPQLFAARKLTLLAIVSGAPSRTEANSLLNEVQSGTELTWNEPTFQFKEPTIEGMVVGTIVGTGVICLFAVIAGLAFGGLRLIVKRVLPGRVFDRPGYVQVLQLGLGSKPINAEDFYATTGGPIANTKVDK
ncbi:MAG TPA: DUF6599 family protein, partial [Candidatus Aquilonibacter sp.]|nr:DUF6599 family protein [Candidatus Aquilonibacter sp.]